MLPFFVNDLDYHFRDAGIRLRVFGRDDYCFLLDLGNFHLLLLC